jgi:hypothetical protein
MKPGNVNISSSTSCKINKKKWQDIYNEMKNKKYHIVGKILKSNRIITKTGSIHTPSIHIYKISFMGAKLLLGE